MLPFGVSVDGDLIFQVSLALLSFLSLLLMFILTVILWLCKIRHQVDRATMAVNLMTNNFWPQMNNAYANSDEGGMYLRQTTFGFSEDQENNEILTNGQNAEAGEPCPADGQRRLYQSIRYPTDINYANLIEDSEETVCTAAAEDLIPKNKNTCSKPETNSAPQDQNALKQTDITDEDYAVMNVKNEGTSAKCCLDSAHNGKNSEILENGEDASQNEYENDYLAIIHTNEASGIPTEGSKIATPCQEDESGYLIPLETPALKGQQKPKQNSDIHSDRKCVVSGVLELTSFLDNSRAHEDGKRCKKKGVAADGSQLKPGDGDEESYDYITTRQVNEWTVSPGNAAKPQERNVSLGNTPKLQDDNLSSSEEAHYINKDPTVPSTISLKNNSAEYLMVVHEREDPNRESHSGEEASTSAKEGRQNTTDQIYENFNMLADNHDNMKVSASAQSQNDTKPTSNVQDSATGACNNSPIYDDPGFDNAN